MSRQEDKPLFKDWNKMTIEEHISHLEDKFRFDSSATSKSVHELIAAYRAKNLPQAAVTQALPLDGIWGFAMFMKDWHEHSSREYFYKSKVYNQWPPDETATKQELLQRYFGGNAG